MAEMAANMVETRNDIRRLYEAFSTNMAETQSDIRRLYEAWPDHMRVVTRAAEDVRRRSTETDASMVRELRNIYDRLDSIERRLP